MPNIDLYNGDCLEVMDKLIAEGIQVDAVITSPPYADRRKNSYNGKHHTEYNDWFIEVAKRIKLLLKSSGSFFLNLKPHSEDGERLLYVMELVILLKKELGFRFVDEFSWTKLGVPGKFKGRFKNAFEPVYHFTKSKDFKHFPYEVATEAKETSLKRYKRKACGLSTNGSGLAGMRKEITSKLALPSNHLHLVQKSNQHTAQSKHPAVFPVELPEFFIKAFTEESDIILDPFTGSGSTGVAAKNLDRNFIGIELDEAYFNIAKDRIEDKGNLFA